MISKPFQLIIFGATGDLARLKLFPAIYDLYIQKRLPESFSIIGFGRTVLSQQDFREIFEKSIEKKYEAKFSKKALADLLEHVEYCSGQYDQLEDFKKLFEFCKNLSSNNAQSKNNDLASNSSKISPLTLAYFSVPPNVFEAIINNLALLQPSAREDLKLILEKPFGYDAKSASKLFKTLFKK